MKSQREKTFNSDLVWACMKYCPYWPARIVTAPPSLGVTPRNKVCVLFFGSKQFGFVDSDKVLSYTTKTSQYIAKGKGWGASFMNAVQQIDEYISNPVKFKSNAAVKASNIVVKSEQIIEMSLGIKREVTSKGNVDAKVTSSLLNNHQPSGSSWAQEKQNLIAEIVSLKSDNQRCTLDLKKTQDKFQAVVSKNQELEFNLNRINAAHMKKESELQSQLTKVKASFDKFKADNDKRISELIHDRDLSQAQAKQLNTVLSQQTESRNQNSSESDQEFEVDRLLLDEIVEKRLYLVRWKNFDSSHDSWVEEANLNCPSILKKYKQSKRK